MKNQFVVFVFIVFGFVLIAVVIRTINFHNLPSPGSTDSNGFESAKNALDQKISQVYDTMTHANFQNLVGFATLPDIVCEDAVWCHVEIPRKSHFRFDAPVDAYRWRRAQSQAASGEQVLLRNVRKAFPHHLDYLDGDVAFRRYHQLVDIFLDHNTDLTELTLKDTKRITKQNQKDKRKKYQWDLWGYNDRVVPRGYDFRAGKRAPIVMVGYSAFSRANHSRDFEGPHLGDASVGLPHLLRRWNEVKHLIDTPFIVLHAGNENWGLFSTEFPNRTVNWGTCCEDYYPDLQKFLDHPMTLAVLVNQHHNLTHPKLISLPRGMPTYTTHRNKYLFDIMRVHEMDTTKDTLMFASNSNWKHRPYVSQCIADKFKNENSTHINAYAVEKKTSSRMTEKNYYTKIVSARTSVCLAGLGYDSFRLWETLTMGTVPIIEKGIGLDKALWRLPALLVEDFDLVTPALLRSAYVEALYRAEAEEFEFERLTQSFWWTFVMNVSTSMTQDAISAKFPPALSEDTSFARPKVPYDCGERMGKCGQGTKRTPKTSCGGKPLKKGDTED